MTTKTKKECPATADGQHHYGSRINGARYCGGMGRVFTGCGHVDYDPQWGAGLFTDWPKGTSKGFGQ